MDTYRGNYLDIDLGDDWPEVEFGEEEALREPPPSPVGQDERRMQVRAYNHWASLLGDRSFPSIEDLDRDALPDFGPYSVMLDFTKGIENPAIRFLGSKLAEECSIQGRIETLEEVPARSLLSRITDHYMQILANQAPIGFEAEFVNQNARTILYRGILLPFSSDDENIDYICGVINWKELADQATTDELMLEIDQALDEGRLLEARRSTAARSPIGPMDLPTRAVWPNPMRQTKSPKTSWTSPWLKSWWTRPKRPKSRWHCHRRRSRSRNRSRYYPDRVNCSPALRS
ncbi:MAG: hypothetical protein RL268_1251 [Pseudomonadota bacterium]